MFLFSVLNIHFVSVLGWGVCRKVLENSTAHLLADDTLSCKQCHRRAETDSVQVSGGDGRTARTTVAYANHDDPNCCPRCGKRVYFAEQILSLGRKWHRPCFSCFECKKTIEVASARDHNQELYCKTCHGRLFGPKGYGFAGGAGTMLSMDTGKCGSIPANNVPAVAQAYITPALMTSDSTVIDGDVCPRCSKQVFIAEKRQAAGKVYHVLCFTCLLCNKKLDSGLLTEKDGDIFCKACYGKNFAPKGYGYGIGAGALQMS